MLDINDSQSTNNNNIQQQTSENNENLPATNTAMNNQANTAHKEVDDDRIYENMIFPS